MTQTNKLANNEWLPLRARCLWESNRYHTAEKRPYESWPLRCQMRRAKPSAGFLQPIVADCPCLLTGSLAACPALALICHIPKPASGRLQLLGPSLTSPACLFWFWLPGLLFLRWLTQCFGCFLQACGITELLCSHKSFVILMHVSFMQECKVTEKRILKYDKTAGACVQRRGELGMKGFKYQMCNLSQKVKIWQEHRYVRNI